jgi:peptidyl-tRNA hydrolase, PTH1 family
VLRVVAGLGNPGGQYEQTRHNVGYAVVDRVAADRGAVWREQRWCSAALAETNFNAAEGPRVPIWLLKPRTFMNLSGDAIAAFCRDKGVGADALLVVVDDIALALGQLRLRSGGSCGGHNGLASIAARVKTTDFPRLRCGVGAPGLGGDAADHVLSRFSPSEAGALEKMIDRAAVAVETACTLGLTAAMNEFNRKIDPGAEPHPTRQT